LDKLRLLKAFLESRSIVLNSRAYSAMIYAYARTGNFSQVNNKILNEMKKNKVKPTQSIFANLLCGCIEEKTGGYKLALEVN
jgi:pentatricopeptide repeat protein